MRLICLMLNDDKYNNALGGEFTLILELYLLRGL